MGPDLWLYENRFRANGYENIAGIDEAGRGPLAGPVVSAAVILPPSFKNPGIRDSKKLSAAKRLQLYREIYGQAVSIGIGIVDANEIDRINILQASLLSMNMSVQNLSPIPDFLMIDGISNIPADIPQCPIPKGDAKSISIAAASIVAKVTRDNLMKMYHLDYPQYGFAKHKGYPTYAHKEAIRHYGCCPIHRRSFRGVKEYLTRVFTDS